MSVKVTLAPHASPKVVRGVKGSACGARVPWQPREHGRASTSHSHGHDSNSTRLTFPMLFLAALQREVSNAAGNGKKWGS